MRAVDMLSQTPSDAALFLAKVAAASAKVGGLVKSADLGAQLQSVWNTGSKAVGDTWNNIDPTAQSALIGAGVGGVAGAGLGMFGKRKRNPLMTGLAGAAAGAGIGGLLHGGGRMFASAQRNATNAQDAIGNQKARTSYVGDIATQLGLSSPDKAPSGAPPNPFLDLPGDGANHDPGMSPARIGAGAAVGAAVPQALSTMGKKITDSSPTLVANRGTSTSRQQASGLQALLGTAETNKQPELQTDVLRKRFPNARPAQLQALAKALEPGSGLQSGTSRLAVAIDALKQPMVHRPAAGVGVTQPARPRTMPSPIQIDSALMRRGAPNRWRAGAGRLGGAIGGGLLADYLHRNYGM